MDKVIHHYYKLFKALWLNVRVMSKLSFDEQKPNGFKVPSVYTFIPLESKRAVMDLTNADLLQETPRYSGDLGDVDNWDELQDKILRVLNYKYHDTDFLYLYYNKDYQNWDAISLSHSDYDEREMETQILQDYEELPKITIQVPAELTYTVLPSRQCVETVYIEDPSLFSRIWTAIKSVFTFKACRKRR